MAKKTIYKICLIFAIFIGFFVIYQMSLVYANYAEHLERMGYANITVEEEIVTYETVVVGELYDNMSFTTIDGDLIKLIGLSLNETNYDVNIKYLKGLIEGTTLYLQVDESGEDVVDGYKMRYAYSSEPTSNGDIKKSLNVFLLRKEICFYTQTLTNNSYEKSLQYVGTFEY